MTTLQSNPFKGAFGAPQAPKKRNPFQGAFGGSEPVQQPATPQVDQSELARAAEMLGAGGGEQPVPMRPDEPFIDTLTEASELATTGVRGGVSQAVGGALQAPSAIASGIQRLGRGQAGGIVDTGLTNLITGKPVRQYQEERAALPGVGAVGDVAKAVSSPLRFVGEAMTAGGRERYAPTEAAKIPYSWRWWIYNAGSGVGTMLPTIATGSIAPSVRLAATVGGLTAGAMETGLAFEDFTAKLQEKGYTKQEADELASYGAVGYGVAAGLVEQLPLAVIFSKAPGLRGRFIKTVTAALAEGSEEAIQEVLNRVAQVVGDIDEDALANLTGDELLQAFAIGGLVGGTFGAFTPGIDSGTLETPQQEILDASEDVQQQLAAQAGQPVQQQAPTGPGQAQSFEQEGELGEAQLHPAAPVDAPPTKPTGEATPPVPDEVSADGSADPDAFTAAPSPNILTAGLAASMGVPTKGQTFTQKQAIEYISTMEGEPANVLAEMLPDERYVVADVAIDKLELLNLDTPGEVDQRKLKDAKDLLASGLTAPPVVVGKYQAVVDGTHRVMAAQQAGKTTVTALVPESMVEELTGGGQPQLDQGSTPTEFRGSRIVELRKKDGTKIEVSSNPVKIEGYEDIDFVIHEDLSGEGYSISEVTTGRSIGGGETVEEAQSNVRSKLRGQRQKFDQVLNKARDEHGVGDQSGQRQQLAARWKELSAKINPDVPISDSAVRSVAAKLDNAITKGTWTDLLHPSNKVSRALFSEVTGVKLPKTLSGTRALFIGKPFETKQTEAEPAERSPIQQEADRIAARREAFEAEKQDEAGAKAEAPTDLESLLADLKAQREKQGRIVDARLEDRIYDIERMLRKERAKSEKSDKPTGFLGVLSADKQARAAELKAKLAKKINTELRSGFDPELLTIGAELASLYVEAGARKFADFARRMVADMGENIRPYLKSFYLAAKHLPGVETEGMDTAGDVEALTEAAIGDLLTEGQEPTEDVGTGQGAEAVPEPDVRPVRGAVRGVAAERGPRGVSEPDGDRGTEEAGDAGGRAGESADAGPAGTGDAKPHRRRTGAGRNAGVAETAGQGEQGDRNAGVRSEDSGDPTGSLPAADLIITDPESLGMGGAKQKFRANMLALEVYRKITAENRHATPDEQKLMAQWVGWGMFPQVFANAREWGDEYRQLKDLLDENEFKAARASTTNAHYTSGFVVKSMWDAMRRLGFRGGRVLEPSMGIGNFFGLMPQEIKADSSLIGVELEPTTAGMAKLIYPNARIWASGFEKVSIPEGFVDLVISNVPFGDYRVSDPEYNRLGLSIHDYFVIRGLDRLRPGGIMAVITSRYTLDKESAHGYRVREEIDKRADLVAAFRLPDTAFEKNAGTEVVTDLLILQRRAEGAQRRGPAFLETVEVPDPGGGKPIVVNEYFQTYPDNILGRLDRSGTMYAAGTVNVSDTGNFRHKLTDAIGRLPEDLFEIQKANPRFDPTTVLDDTGAKDGGLVVQGGKTYQKQRGALIAKDVSEKDQKIIAGMIGVRDAARQVLAAEIKDLAPAEIDKARANLNRLYDAFRKKHGLLSKRTNAALFAEDPDWGFVVALDDGGEKSAMFSQRTVRGYKPPEHATTVEDALGITLTETGTVKLERMAELIKKPEADIAAYLSEKGLAYQDPSAGWVQSAVYLSGNVKKKLEQARTAAEADKSFQINVEALEKVQPADIPYEEIEPQLGSPWIMPSDIAAFGAELLKGSPEDFSIAHNHGAGQWFADHSNNGRRLKDTVQSRKVYGTPYAPFVDLLESSLNRQQITVRTREGGDEKPRVNKEETEAARDKQREIEELFKDWIWKDEDRRVRLHRFYNDQFNNSVRPKYDGSFLTLPGSNPMIKMASHQKDGIWRIIVDRRAMLAHEVGTGKTYTKIAAAMELRRLGLARKPAIAVLNATGAQYVKSARLLYPAAKILSTVGVTDANKRRKLMSQIATGDYDLIILTHEHLTGLPVRPELEEQFIREQIAELEAAIAAAEEAGANSRFIKRMEKQKADLEAGAASLLEKKAIKSDNAVFFEETGIDFLFVDEAHHFKSVPIHSGIQVKGIPSGGAAGRAAQMFMKARYLQSIQKGGGVVLATGTPITNSVAELFVLQRFLQEPDLFQRNIQAFDSWAGSFGTITTKVEFAVEGTLRETSRFAKFINVPDLQNMFGQVVDIRFAADMPWMIRPKKNDRIDVGEITEEQWNYMQELAARAAEIRARKRPPEKGDDILLTVANDGRMMSLDTRLVAPEAPDRPESKVNRAVRAVLANHQARPNTTQMIFLDRYQSKHNPGFSVIEDIISKLEAGGIPRDRIINFTGLTDAGKKTAADRLNDGDAIIGIGSTPTMGTGVNAQKRLWVLHHLDAPWTPAEMEQRIGRGWRQGNLNDPTKPEDQQEIQNVTYITEKSFDQFMWQALARKQAFIRQVLTGDGKQRIVEEDDSEEMSAEVIMALATGDPRVLQKVQLDADLERMQRQRRRHEFSQLDLKSKAKQLEERDIPRQQKLVGLWETALSRFHEYKQATADQPLTLEIEGKQYTAEDVDAAVQAVDTAAGRRSHRHADIGRVWEFPVRPDHETIEGRVTSAALKLADGAEIGFRVQESNLDPKTLQKTYTSVLFNSLRSMLTENKIAGALEQERTSLQVKQNELQAVQEQINQPFKHEAEFLAKKAERDALVKAMNPPKQGEQKDDPPDGVYMGSGFGALQPHLERIFKRIGERLGKASIFRPRIPLERITGAGDLPSIEIENPVKDIGLIAMYLAAPLNAAYASKDQQVIGAVEDMIDLDLMRQNETTEQLRQDRAVYKELPKAVRRKDKGAEFFEWMDQYVDPATIDARDDIPAEIKPVLKHFKEQDEKQRQEIIRRKREVAQAMYEGMTYEQQAEAAAGFELAWTVTTRRIRGLQIAALRDENGNLFTDKQEAATRLAKLAVPDDWGRQFSHIQHAFFGQYKLSWLEETDEGPKEHFIGRAETPAEAYRKLDDFRKDPANQAIPIDALKAVPEVMVPPDIVRVSSKRLQVLKSQLRQAAEAESKEINEALRGVVGQRKYRQKFWGALLHREGAAGFDKDFWRVWTAQVEGFMRWKYLTRINQQVQPIIERLKETGRPRWANHLADILEFTWGTKQPAYVEQVDDFIRRIPFIGDRVKPMALPRMLASVRTLNYWRQLQTGKQFVINSLQVLQTLYPVVGEKGFYRGVRLYYSKRGKAILKRWGFYDVHGKFHEGTSGQRTYALDKFTPMGISEARNQNLAFVTLFDQGKRNGLSDEQAARYARLRGQVMTQFAFTRANQPRFLRGPVASTAFQYKRFVVNQLGLLQNMWSDPRYGGKKGVARWLITMTAIGGLKSIWPSSILGLMGRGALLALIYGAIDDEWGEEAANAIVFGLPGLLGIDLSGSVEVVQAPYGNTPQEKIGNLVLGPTGQFIVRAGTEAGDTKKADDISTLESIGRTAIDTSPSIKQFQSLLDLISGNTAQFDAKGRKRYNASYWDLWRKSFGFRTINESKERLRAEWVKHLIREYDSAVDAAAIKLSVNDRAGAMREIRKWNSMFPEARITLEEVRGRAASRKEARKTELQERREEAVPEAVRKVIKRRDTVPSS